MLLVNYCFWKSQRRKSSKLIKNLCIKSILTYTAYWRAFYLFKKSIYSFSKVNACSSFSKLSLSRVSQKNYDLRYFWRVVTLLRNLKNFESFYRQTTHFRSCDRQTRFQHKIDKNRFIVFKIYLNFIWNIERSVLKILASLFNSSLILRLFKYWFIDMNEWRIRRNVLWI